jgi:hypothetical protein
MSNEATLDPADAGMSTHNRLDHRPIRFAQFGV